MRHEMRSQISEQEFKARFQDVWDAADRETRLSLRESHIHEIASRLFDQLGRRVTEPRSQNLLRSMSKTGSEGVLPIDGVLAILDEIGLPCSIVSNTYSP